MFYGFVKSFHNFYEMVKYNFCYNHAINKILIKYVITLLQLHLFFLIKLFLNKLYYDMIINKNKKILKAIIKKN